MNPSDNNILSVSQDNENSDLSISENSIITQNNGNQVSILENQGSKSFTDLQNLIDSNKNGTIDLDSDYAYNSNDNKNGILIINKSITINGNNHIINANNHYIVFNISSSTVKLNNLHLINAYEDDRNWQNGLVEFSKSNVTFINSSFSNTKGRVFHSFSSNFTLDGCKVMNISQAYPDNASRIFNSLVLYSSSSNILINNSLFKDIGEGGYAGSILSSSDNFIMDNSNFTNSSSIEKGGVLYLVSGYANVSNCNFDKCSSRKAGGVIFTNKEKEIIIKNSTFSNNYLNSSSADTYTFIGKGGACDFGDSNVTIIGSKFNNNSANLGGAIFFENKKANNTNVLNIEDCDFDNNSAIYGGSIYSMYNHLTSVNNSKFNNGNSYFGGAITCAGGNLTVDNGEFKNCRSKFGGAIVTDKNLTIANSKFSNNHANVGNDIAKFNSTFNLINTSADVYTFDNLLHTTERNYRNVSINDTSNGFCSEVVIHPPDKNQDFFVYDTSIFYNKLNNKAVNEYFKILLYNYYFKSNLTAFELQKAIWAFSDYQYWNIDAYPDLSDRIKHVVKDVIGIYDSGFRVPDYGATDVLDNGSVRVYQFASLFSPVSQNLFNFKFTYIDNVSPDINIEKVALNKTVELNNQSSFNIIIKNNGTIMLDNITVYENNYDGLIYNSWKPVNGIWIFNGDSNKPTWLLRNLGINQTASIEVTFNTTKIGNFTNVVFVKSNETNNKTTNSSVEVANPKPHNNETVNNNTNSSDNKTTNNNNNSINKISNHGNNTRINSNSVHNSTNIKGGAIAEAVGAPGTGNPISIILLALMLLCLIPIKNKK